MAVLYNIQLLHLFMKNVLGDLSSINASFVSFQIIVGIALMILGTLDINEGSATQRAADIINNISVILVFIITVVNIIIASFSIENTNIIFMKAQPVANTAEMRRLDIIK